MTTQKSKEDMSRAEARKIVRSIHPDMLGTECVHHIDKNPMNNDLGNLVVMDRWEHQELHRESGQSLVMRKLVTNGGFTEKEAEKFIKKIGL